LQWLFGAWIAKRAEHFNSTDIAGFGADNEIGNDRAVR